MKNYYNFLIPLLISGLIFWGMNGYSNTDSYVDKNLGVEVFHNNVFTAEDIYINEINYRSPGEEDIDFIELYNSGTTAVDLSGWSLTDGITYTFPSGTSIGAGAYIVIAASPSDLQSEFGISGVLGPYNGSLSSDEDEIILRDNNFIIIDEVEYESWQEWPAVRYNNDGDDAISIQKLNPTLPSKDAGSWSSAFPTPQLINSVFLSNINEIPIVNSVSKNPDKPTSSEVVRIKTDISNIDDITGSLTVNLEYQIVDPGNYISKSSTDYLNNWIAVPMLDDGTGPDSTANNGVFTVELPTNIQQHRRLVRYRVNVSHSSGYTRTFPDPNHTTSNYAYYVYDNYPLVNGYDINTLPELQEITIITDESTREEFIGDGTSNTNQYTGKDLMGEGTIVYKGKVYDHISFRPKGSNSRKHRVKPNIKVDFNSERKITTESDCGKSYSQGKSKLTLGGTWSGNIAAHGLNESLVYTVNRLSGTIPRNNDYAQLRIVDSSSELDNLEDFWGIFLIQEEYDGDYLNEHDFAEGNFWKTNRATRNREISHQGDFLNSESIPTYAPYDLKNSRDTLDTNANLPIAYGMIAANYIYGLNGNNYIGKHSYNEYYDSETQKYLSWWSDMDNAFGSPFDDVVTFTRDQVQYETFLKNRLDIIDEPLIIGFNNKLRSVIDLLLTDEQIDFLVDMESKKIYDPNASYDWATVDKSRWNQDYDLGTIDAHVDWYKQWFQTRKAFLLDSILVESEIPAKPSISLSGNTSLNNMTFSASSFSDPQGANTFAAMEWRIGEWSDPANPIYASCEPIYEIQNKWTSGEITSFSDSFTFPFNAQLEAGRTYKIRVRYKDNTERWSHWSDAVSLVATPAVNPSAPQVVINEIMYNDSDCGTQFIELKNLEDNAVDLSSFSFTDGIDYTFPEGTSLGTNEVLVIAKDIDDFVLKYGYAPLGEFDGSLDDKGERLELTGWFGAIVDSLTYDNKNPWDEAPSEEPSSLELLDPYSDNNEPANWFRSDVNCGTPSVENTRVCSSTAASIVINEINYNSSDDFDSGDWVELYNPNSDAVNISGWTLYDNGNEFIIPQGTTIPADGYLVLVESSALFSNAFPNVPTDQYLGDISFSFSNKGERISLFDEGKCLADYVVYDDDAPWPLDPDGEGPTLALIHSSLDNASFQYWKPSDELSSYYTYGSPGASNYCSEISHTILCNRISNSIDDAEENISTGEVSLTSGDLDIGNDEGVIFKVGMRFRNIQIPKDAIITSAVISFAADETNNEVTSVIIKGQDVNNAGIFNATTNNISNRTTTSSSVTWQPNPWNIGGENGTNQKTADISTIIQEIVDRPGFIAGNAIALIIESTGIRTAESFDGSSELAPELCITYRTGQCGIKAKVLLEGFHDAANNNMHTKLQNNNLLPLAQPYNVAPWNYQGTESVTAIPAGAVDWVLIMTRDTDGNVLDQAAGFINQDGNLINLAGDLGIPIANAFGNQFSIHHRSHLAVLSANSYSDTTYDFTTSQSQAAGNEQLKLIDGKYMLYGGDYDNTGIINSSDFNLWTIQSAIINQYIPIDGDGNGIVNSLDYNLWTNNKSKVGEPIIWY